MAIPATTAQWIIDVDESTFQQDVIERSKQVPVVVDYWAVWCGPCRSLGPILERLSQEYGGRFILARLNVDENPNLAARYDIQGIPAVKAFRDGRVASEFVGALPRPAVQQFIEKLMPDGVDAQLGAGRSLLAAGKLEDAEKKFREILAENPAQAGALLGLAQTLLAGGQTEMATEFLDHVPPATPEGAVAARLQTEMLLRREAGDAQESDLRLQLETNPGDLETRYRLGALLTVAQRYEEALEQFLDIVRRNRSFRNDGARQTMLHIFDVLGDDPLARNYRNRLASVLFA